MYCIRVTDGKHTEIIGPFDTVGETQEYIDNCVPEVFVMTELAVIHELIHPDETGEDGDEAA